MRYRCYNVQCIEHCEFLILHHNELDKMKKEYYSIAKEFYKRQMQQTKLILSFHLHMLKTFGKNDLTMTGRFVSNQDEDGVRTMQRRYPQRISEQLSTDLNSTLQFSHASSEESSETQKNETSPSPLAVEPQKPQEGVSQ